METSAGPSDIARSLALIANRLDARLSTIVQEMRDLLASRIDGLGDDRQLVDMLQASIEGNVSTVCHILANDIDLKVLQPTTAAVEYAVRLAQRGVPVSALTRAYHLGQSMFLQLAMDEVKRQDVPDSLKVDVVRAIADAVHRYIDGVLQIVTAAHDAERRRWRSARAAAQAGIILKILRRERVSNHVFESATGYPLTACHVGLIAWTVDDSDDPTPPHVLDGLIQRLSLIAGSSRRPLTTAADRATVWAWIADPQHTDDTMPAMRAEISKAPGVRVAIGAHADNIEGFRRTHEQAMSARFVALAGGRYRHSSLVGYTDPDVAILALLGKDAIATAAWAREVLGSLADPSEQGRLTRETLSAFYANGENYVRTAAALGIHRNTVRHRITNLDSDRTDLAADPLQIALALRVYDEVIRPVGEE